MLAKGLSVIFISHKLGAVMAIADDIDEIERTQEARRVSLISQYGYPSDEGMGPNADPSYANPDRRSMSGQGRSRWSEFRRQQEIWQAEIGELEDDILAELAEVRTEYRSLAETLNNGRTNYVNHYLQAQALTEQFPNVTRDEVRRSGAHPGPMGVMASHHASMSSYEATYHDYKMIEEGFKHTTVRETLAALAWGAVGLIVTEIVTFGIGKFVAIGAAAIRLTTVGRTLARAGDIGAALISRFMAFTEATRRRVVNVVSSLSWSEIVSDRIDCTTMKIDSTNINTNSSAVIASTKPGQILASNRPPLRRDNPMI